MLTIYSSAKSLFSLNFSLLFVYANPSLLPLDAKISTMLNNLANNIH